MSLSRSFALSRDVRYSHRHAVYILGAQNLVLECRNVIKGAATGDAVDQQKAFAFTHPLPRAERENGSDSFTRRHQNANRLRSSCSLIPGPAWSCTLPGRPYRECRAAPNCCQSRSAYGSCPLSSHTQSSAFWIILSTTLSRRQTAVCTEA